LQAHRGKERRQAPKPEELEQINAKVDESSIESFPASDPPSFNRCRIGAPLNKESAGKRSR
jgi:hypothetical protein